MSDAKKPDLMSRSLIDLREMLERENKLLANERFLARLKDKGEKIRQFRDEIERAIQIKQSLEETESFLAKLSLGEKAILPKHPMFSANSHHMQTAKQATGSQPKSSDVVKELLSGDLDIYSVALSNTFDEQLSQRRSERFVLNRIPKGIRKPNAKQSNEKQPDDKQLNKAEPEAISKENFEAKSEVNSEAKSEVNPKANPETKSETKQEANSGANQESNREATPGEQKPDKKAIIAEKYRHSALEVYDKKEKLVTLSLESSLEFGKEQKLKDFEVEKLRLENRLTWRAIQEFDSDESSSDDDAAEDMDAD